MTTSSAAKPVKVIKVLWMDDKPDSIKKIRQALRRGQSQIDIEIVSSIDEARAKLEGNIAEYDAFVVDCKMDDDDDTVNGAAFLVEVNELYKSLPTFVFSAYWSDIPFRSYIEQSYAIKVEGRRIYRPPLEENEFFAKLIHVGERYSAVKDLKPEQIEFEDYISDPAQYTQVVQTHRIKYDHRIKEELRRKNWVWGVVCGENLVEGSSDIFKLPNKQSLHQIGRERNRIPFIYSDPLPTETIMPSAGSHYTWNTTRFPGDFYPTIRASFGADFVTDDFDTGATQTIVSDRLVQTDEFDIWEKNVHFGVEYRYVQKQVNLCLVDSDGNEQTNELPVRVVEGWDKSPFRKVNGSREILFGRDILRAFKIELCLDSDKRTTKIRFI